MIPGELVGGTNFLPSSVCSIFLIVKILSRQKGSILIEVALRPSRLGLLFFFYIWCLASAFFMPRIFAGFVDVIPIAVQYPFAVPLQPTAANITQPAYLTISVFLCVAGYFGMKDPIFLRHWLQSTAVGGAALVFTGALDLFTTTLGISDILEPFRNSSHILIQNADVLGAQRVIGLMDEASVYGSSCVIALAFLTFTRPFFLPIWRNFIVPFIMAGLFIFAILSTSSAAYVGIFVFATSYVFSWIRRYRSVYVSSKRGLTTEATFALVALTAFLAIVTLYPSLLDPVISFLDAVVFDKSSSSSYADRNMTTYVGMQAFLQTYGVGVGFGGARTSNWFVGELANTGLAGSTLLGSFILFQLGFSGRLKKTELRDFSDGLRLSYIPSFVMQALIGTTPDLFGTFGLGILCSIKTYTAPTSIHNDAGKSASESPLSISEINKLAR